MPSASEELQNNIRESSFINKLEREVAGILRRFEESDRPVVYDEKKETEKSLKAIIAPWQENLLSMLGFIDEEGGGYDYRTSYLNQKAREMYERLKKEGYYENNNILITRNLPAREL